jgi:hypothetical protein
LSVLAICSSTVSSGSGQVEEGLGALTVTRAVSGADGACVSGALPEQPDSAATALAASQRANDDRQVRQGMGAEHRRERHATLSLSTMVKSAEA